MFKKIYIEITNICNLNCSFCPHNKRTIKNMKKDEFKNILDKIENYTKYIYLHVLGEPLMHPNFNEFVDLASNKYEVNITTNGYLIDRIKTKNIRQLNISLQSFDLKNNITLDEYMSKIFSVIDYLKSDTYISLRMWVKNKYTSDILKKLEERYNRKLEIYNNYKNISLEKNVFLSFNEEFQWPNINNKSLYKTGTCYALKDHIAILVDGTVVPCCLDSEGSINLGNIHSSTLDEIINSSRYQNMYIGFKNNKKCEKLCETCNFIK